MNLKKFERMSALSFENGLRLHDDAILLFNNKSYPSAYLLSVLSLEEIGKSIALEDYVWNNAVNGRSPEYDQEFIKHIYNHEFKQVRFARNSDAPFNCSKAVSNIFEGNLDSEKQASTYVGLRKIKGKIDYDGKIVNPLKTTQKKVLGQITIVNDYLVVLAISCIKGTHSADLLEIESFFTHEFVNRLRKQWPIMSKRAKNQFNQIIKFDDLSLEDRGL